MKAPEKARKCKFIVDTFEKLCEKIVSMNYQCDITELIQEFSCKTWEQAHEVLYHTGYLEEAIQYAIEHEGVEYLSECSERYLGTIALWIVLEEMYYEEKMNYEWVNEL